MKDANTTMDLIAAKLALDGSNHHPRIAEMKSLAAKTLSMARALGATAAEAVVSANQGLTVSVRKDEVDTLQHHRRKGFAVTVYFGARKGSATSTDWRPEALEHTVKSACDIARNTEQDPFAGLADADQMASEPPDLDLDHPWDISATEAIEVAREVERAALACDPGISRSDGATLNTHRGVSVYGNSHGFISGYPGSRHSLSCSVIGELGGEMQRDHWYTLDRSPESLEPPALVGERAARRTVNRLGSRRLSTRRCPVLFTPEIARSLLGHFVAAIRGENLYRKASFLVDGLGTQVFPAGTTIVERPHLRGAVGSSPFDSEGVATRERDLVVDGVLQGYVLSSYSARKLGMTTTANAGGVHNLELLPGTQDYEDLLRLMDTGLVVCEMMGQGANIVTGDYSRGAAGFWVEGGVVAYPVEEITVAGNLADMFLHTVAVGQDMDVRGNIRTGSILVEEMAVAGD